MSWLGRLVHPKDDTQIWKGRYYPYDLVKELCIAVGVIGLLAVLLTILFSSPDEKPSTVAQWSRQMPQNFVTSASEQLAGTSGTATYGPPYNHNGTGQEAWILKPQKWLGVSHPIDTEQDYVVGPLETVPNDPAADGRAQQLQGRAGKAEKGMGRSVRQAPRRNRHCRRRRKEATEHRGRERSHRHGHRQAER